MHKVIHLVVGTSTKEVVFAGLRWVWVQFGAFGKMECLFSMAPEANSCGWHVEARVKKTEEMPVSVK